MTDDLKRHCRAALAANFDLGSINLVGQIDQTHFDWEAKKKLLDAAATVLAVYASMIGDTTPVFENILNNKKEFEADLEIVLARARELGDAPTLDQIGKLVRETLVELDRIGPETLVMAEANPTGA